MKETTHIETDVSHYDQMTYYPLSKLHIEQLRMIDMLTEQGFEHTETYRYEKFESLHTVMGVVGIK